MSVRIVVLRARLTRMQVSPTCVRVGIDTERDRMRVAFAALRFDHACRFVHRIDHEVVSRLLDQPSRSRIAMPRNVRSDSYACCAYSHVTLPLPVAKTWSSNLPMPRRSFSEKSSPRTIHAHTASRTAREEVPVG